MNKFRIQVLCLIRLFSAALSSSADPQQLLTPQNYDQWQARKFVGKTQYQWIDMDGPALRAVSKASASGMFLEREIDLHKTPYLHWQWRIENTLDNQREQSREGDDYAARIYVIISGGIFFWRSRALNYVWSSSQPINSHWPNAFTEHAQMLAVRSGDELKNQWISERRDLRADLKRYLGKDIQQIDGLAIMTDTDNTGQSATAYYRDVYFAAE